MKTRKVPIWENYGAAVMYQSLIAYNKRLPTSLISPQGEVVDQNDPRYCRYACQSDSLENCARIPMRDDIALGLLATTVDAVEDVNETPVVITMGQILERFRLPPDANRCGRGDLVKSTKAIINSADEACPVDLIQATSMGDIPASLTMARTIVATPQQSTKTAVWNEPTQSFVVNVHDSGLAPYFSGPIDRAGRTKAGKIFMRIRGREGISCSEIMPRSAGAVDVKEISDRLRQDASLLPKSLKSISDYRAELYASVPDAVKSEINAVAITKSLMPYREYLKQLADIAEKNGLMALHPKEPDPARRGGLAEVIKLLDIYQCGEANKGHSISELSSLIPVLDVRRSDDAVVKVRTQVAEDIILCKFGAEEISPEARAIIQRQLVR